MKRRLLLLALLLSLVLFFNSHPTPPVQLELPPITAPTVIPTNYMVKLGHCPEATMCILDIVGEPTVLGKQVAVLVGAYQAPSANYYGCRLEQWKGKRAAKFLEETIRSAAFVFLTNVHKKRGSSYLSGTLLVDGQDVTVLMFDMKLAVPRGIKVDWCEEISRGFEV